MKISNRITGSNQKIHIMSSCDDNLIPYLSILIHSIAENVSEKEVCFYLFYSRVSELNLQALKKQCSAYKRFTFFAIRVSNPEVYDELASYGSWKVKGNSNTVASWGGEAYYSLGVWKLLPPDVDRILYLDAGDTLIVGNVEPYYFEKFDGCSLIVTAGHFKIQNQQLTAFDSDDLCVPEYLRGIVRGVFNSGSYVMNLQKMREEKVDLDQYAGMAKMLYSIEENKGCAYFGDQGLLSAAHVGDIKYYGYPAIKDIWYRPYNFCMWYFDGMKEKPDYIPVIIHYCGDYLPFKPWKGNYPVFLERFQKKEELQDLGKLKLGQAEYYYMWHEYAIKTDKLLTELGIEMGVNVRRDKNNIF